MFKNIKSFVKQNAVSFMASIAGIVGSVALSGGAIHATTAEDIGTIASAVGTPFQDNAVVLLTDVLPYVVTIAILFLAAKLALRWMKKSAH